MENFKVARRDIRLAKVGIVVLWNTWRIRGLDTKYIHADMVAKLMIDTPDLSEGKTWAVEFRRRKKSMSQILKIHVNSKRRRKKKISFSPHGDVW